MQSKLFRITLNTCQPDLLLRFYGVLGFQFNSKSVDKGSQAWVGAANGLTLEIFGIQESYSNKSPGVQMSFEVSSVEDKVAQFRALKAQIMLEPYQMKSGSMAVVIDPDGRSVELMSPS